MPQPDNRISDSPFSKWVENSAPLDDGLETVRLSAARAAAAALLVALAAAYRGLRVMRWS
jgi:hypothetical protein